MVQFGSDQAHSGINGHFGRAGRYAMVSVVNVANHQLLLQLALHFWSWSGGWANAFAASAAAVPAYFMSRYWVWEVRGRSSLRNEILPFWGIALVGLVVSSFTAEAADRLFAHPLMVSAGSIAGYFVVWLGKFLLLGRLFEPGRAADERFNDTLVDRGV